jgi:general secretion pathway protein M
MMVSVATAVVFLALAYLLVWDPLHSRVSHLRQTVDEQQSLKRWMQQAAVEAKQLRRGAVSGADAGRSLLAVVDQTSKQSQLGPAVKTIQPDGQDLVRVSLEQASFDDLVLWVDSLRSVYGVSIVDATIDRQSEAGRVNAHLTLKKVGS